MPSTGPLFSTVWGAEEAEINNPYFIRRCRSLLNTLLNLCVKHKQKEVEKLCTVARIVLWLFCLRPTSVF